MATSIERIIRAAVERGASDLHIKAGDVFRARIDGRLVALTKQRLTPEQTRTIALRLVGTEEDRARLDRVRDFDCSWGMPGVGRFRVNILRQRSSYMVVMRVIPFAVPTLEALGLPDVLRTIAEAEQGLVLVSGTSGSGKSSTMAAMVHHVNTTRERHIVTVENPIEFLHRDLKSSVTQREVGVDTDSLVSGVRAALRQDPDVVVLSELPDAGALEAALSAAELGHLVIAALPAPDAVTAVTHLLTMLPPDAREIGRLRAISALTGVIAQQLLPRADGQGRVPAVEVLRATPEVRRLLQEDAAVELEPLMAAGSEGMQTFEQHLEALLAAGVIERDAVRATAAAPPRAGRKRRVTDV